MKVKISAIAKNFSSMANYRKMIEQAKFFERLKKSTHDQISIEGAVTICDCVQKFTIKNKKNIDEVFITVKNALGFDSYVTDLSKYCQSFKGCGNDIISKDYQIKGHQCLGCLYTSNDLPFWKLQYEYAILIKNENILNLILYIPDLDDYIYEVDDTIKTLVYMGCLKMDEYDILDESDHNDDESYYDDDVEDDLNYYDDEY